MTLEVRSESPCLMGCDMICTSAWLAVGEHHWSASHCSVPVGHLCHLFLTQSNWSHVRYYSPWMMTNETSHIAKQKAPIMLQEFTHCVNVQAAADVSQLRVPSSPGSGTPRRRRHCEPSQHQELLNLRYSTAYQNTENFKHWDFQFAARQHSSI